MHTRLFPLVSLFTWCATALLSQGSVASTLSAQDYPEGPTNTCRNYHYYCPTCGGSPTEVPSGTECFDGTSAYLGSWIDNVGLEHHHEAWDYVTSAKNNRSGCVPCGASAGGAPETGALPSLTLKRVHRYRFSSFPSAFGPGVFSEFNDHLELDITNTTTGVGKVLYFFVDGVGRTTLTDTSSLFGDTTDDGIYHDNSFGNIAELRLLSAAGTPVADQKLAVTAVLRKQDGSRLVYEVIRTSTDVNTTQRWGRLLRREDRNGNAIAVAYNFPRDATDAAMANSRAKLWQIASATDAYGRAATFTYATAQAAGRWVVSSIALPNGGTISYGYDANGLSQVTYPDGAISTFTRTPDTAKQLTVVHYVEAGAEGVHRRKHAWMTNSTYVQPDSTTINQTSGMIRKLTNGADELVYWNQEETGNPQIVYTYEGGTMLRRLTTSNFDHARKSEVATNYVPGQLLSATTFETVASYATNGQARISAKTDILGRATSFAVDGKSSTLTKITYPDASIGTATYNSFAQQLHVVDRLGRVTDLTYDAAGNLTAKTVAVGAPEQATWTWTYNARGQVLEERDALYDATKPDLHVTSFVYNAAGYLINRIDSADVAGGTRPTRTFFYDSAGRLTKTTDPDGRAVDYTYDSRNRVTKISYGSNVGITTDFETFAFAITGADVNLLTRHKDRNDNNTDFSYDAAGRISRTTYAVGQADATGTKDCTYLPGTELLAACVEFGDKVSYGYDYWKRKVSTARQARTTATLTDTVTYDTARRIAFATDAYGRRTFYVYDVNDRVIRIVRDLIVGGTPSTPALPALTRIVMANPPYVIEDTVYDAAGQVTSRIDGRGITHTAAYDKQGRQIQQVQAAAVPADPVGLVALAYTTLFTYDKQGNRTAVTLPRTGQAGETGTFQTTSVYSGRNLLLSQTEAAGRSEAATRSATYTLTGKKATEKDFRGKSTSFAYYPCCDRLKDVIEPGNFKTSYQYDRQGNVIAVTDPNNNTTTTTYDGRHRVATVTNAENEKTTYTYDDNASDAVGVSGTYASKFSGLSLGTFSDGSAVLITNALNETAIQIRDGLGRLVRTVDGNGNLITTAYDTVNLTLLQTEITDAALHTTLTRADAAGRMRASEDGENRKTTYGYDPNGNRLSVRDPNSVGQDCVYDAANRDIRCTDTAGAKTERTYNAHSTLVTAKDALTHVTTHAYDGRERKTSTTDRIAGVTTFAYDANSNLVKITDAELPVGRVTDYAYDDRNLLVSEIYPPGEATPTAGADKRTYTYDAGRRLATRTDQTGAVTTYVYDKANRLISRNYPDALNDSFVYDDASRLTTATSGRFSTVVARTYDVGGRLAGETQTVGGYPFTVGYGYDVDNLTTRITYPNGKQVLKTYTARHQLASVSYDGSSIATRSYDVGGRFTTTTYGNSAVEARTYNADNTVATIVVPGVTNFSYTYDKNKRKTYEGHQFASDIQEFPGYDDENRLTSWKRDGVETQTWTLSKVGDWLSTVRNGTTETRTHSPVHETLTSVIGGVSQNLDYDQKGNLTVDRNGQVYTWDQENRLIGAVAGAAANGYAYDALGRRLAKVAGGKVTTFVHDGAQVIAEYETPIYQSADSGTPALAGSFSDPGTGTITLVAGGTDIWGTSDQFRYAYGKMTGNGTIVARVTGQTNTNAWAKAGLMFRESLSADARNAAVLLSPSNGVTFQRRATAAAATVNTVTAGITGPVWLKLSRVGTSITASRSADGFTWTVVGTDTVAFPATPIYVGLAATSHNAAALSTVTFTNVAGAGNFQTAASPVFARGYVYGSYVDELLAIISSTGLPADRKFAHANHLYSVAALTDNSGNVVERYRYDAYGQRTVLAADGTTIRTASSYGNQYGFTGRYLDKETGLWYFRARHYSAAMGRFTGRDKKNYIDGLSLYSAYFIPCFLDPSGNGTYTQTEMNSTGGRTHGKEIIADITVRIDEDTSKCKSTTPLSYPSGPWAMCPETKCEGEVSFTVFLKWNNRFADTDGDDPDQTKRAGLGFPNPSARGGRGGAAQVAPDPGDPAHKGTSYTASGPLGTAYCSGDKKTLTTTLFSGPNAPFYIVTVEIEVEKCGIVKKKEDSLKSGANHSWVEDPVKVN
jgi:RHS repeat-associated protein